MHQDAEIDMRQVCNKSAIEGAISTLANNMRMYVEAYTKFASLFEIDCEEAINNRDRAFEAKLEAFHTLYDVSKSEFPYFDYGDTTLLIAVRNAIHHRDHPLFRSLHARLFLEHDPSRYSGATFLLATYSTRHGAPIPMNHYIRLDDIELRLDPGLASPHRDVTLKLEKANLRLALIEQHLSLDRISQKGLSERYPKDQIYLDLMPIFTSGVCRVFKAMKTAGVAFKGYDAELYLKSFTSEINVDLRNPIFKPTHFR